MSQLPKEVKKYIELNIKAQYIKIYGIQLKQYKEGNLYPEYIRKEKKCQA
jgi:hypothetical protein